jgi:hypothetical protein
MTTRKPAFLRSQTLGLVRRSSPSGPGRCAVRWRPGFRPGSAPGPPVPRESRRPGRRSLHNLPPADFSPSEHARGLCPGVHRFPHSEIAVELVLRRVVFRRPAVAPFKRALARAHDDAATRAQGLDQFLDEDGFAGFDFHCRRCAPEVAATGVALSLWWGMERCQERPILRRLLGRGETQRSRSLRGPRSSRPATLLDA